MRSRRRNCLRCVAIHLLRRWRFRASFITGIVTLKYTVSCTLDVVCDRCLTELKRDYSYDFSHTVVPSLQSEGDIYDTYLVAQHDSIDMNETAISDLLLMLPTKMLCREDCKGLCDICGCNLNERTCNCRK